MSLLKLNRTKTLDGSVFKAVPSRALYLDNSTVNSHRFKLSRLSLALTWQTSLAIGLFFNLLMAPANAEDSVQAANNANDEYIYSQKAPQAVTSTNQTVNIAEISQNLEKGSYQPIPLQSIIDPSTGVPIDDVYRIDVPEKLSLLQAQNVLLQVSPKLASNNAGIISNELTSEATKGLNQPLVFLRAGATHYNLDANLDLSGLQAGIQERVNEAKDPATGEPLLSEAGQAIIGDIIDQRIPDSYDIKRKGDTTSAGVAMLWPVYTAGRTKAVTSLADARTEESQADALLDKDQLQTTLVERYFTAQLAMLAAYLREDALNTVKETDHMAQRYLEEGFISGVDRLEAKTALAEAESEAIKARHDAKLAMTALQRLLRSPQPIKPTTPLFVSSKPLPSLQYFQDLALRNHPGLKKVDAKYAQAQSLSDLSDTGFKPTVSVFGYHELKNDPSWIAGISASWKLWGGLNKDAQHASSEAKMRQAQLAKIDVSDNILLLVEKNWQSVENARVRFQSLNSNVLLAQELLRYKQLGMKEGVNTALDVTTAQTKYLQARTEQASAANDYVQALAALMESIGTPEAFNEYMAVADIRLPTVY
ncbi:TolC family protein [Psychrobacter sanguinis]|uniref:TolC family protein n=1 Tax=Psychrobacter sanguinis TaxID=861445 RepID=UPI002897703A|nr:TolC family protein [Psychrobacter sanguinis]